MVDKIQKIINDLDANFNEEDEETLLDIYEEISSIASNISNRKSNDEKLYPYIKKAVKAEYLKRGVEGTKSNSENGGSYTFEDTIEKLRDDIIKNHLRRVK